MEGLSGRSSFQIDSDIDVAEDDGLIIIAEDKIPDNWPDAEDKCSYRGLDRNFVFAGEQVRLLICLSENKHNSGIITPSENVVGQRSHRENEEVVGGTNSFSHAKYANTDEQKDKNGEARGNSTHSQKDASTGESIPGNDDQRRHTDQLLQRFEDSHFFARIAESNEPLWSERSAQEACFKLMETCKEKLTGDSSETAQILKNKNPTSVVIDRGELHSPTSGGVARGAAKCFSLSNGDIVVILQVKVGVEFMMDPILEILQLEKYHERKPFLETQQVQASFNKDPYKELLNWLLPVNNSRRSSARPLSPDSSSSPRPSIRTSTSKRSVSVSSATELFSFGHVRSYSMSSLQPNKLPPEAVMKTSARSSSVQEDHYQYSFRSFIDIGNSGNEKLLSFRGVPLVPDRFSVQCGLEGLFTPGRRWRRKFDLIQPLEIHSFCVDCNADDLLCVCVKNVSPAYAPDVVVFIDSIMVVFEEASSSGPPLPLPVTCTESGNEDSLPNLALRRGEEHSFILKPVTTLWRDPKVQTGSNLGKRRTSTRAARSSPHPFTNTKWRYSDAPAVQYAVLVSCRCNYTESKLFFRHPVNWQPHFARDLMISVASDMSRRTVASHRTQLPVQALYLQASNMTPDDLTLTVMTPAPSPLCLSPDQAQITEDGPQSDSISNRFAPLSNMIPSSDLSCTHLCMQTRVPLGCVPSQSTVAINLELVPLTNGIITLDSLQIDVKEKGRYKPKHALKIAAASTPIL
ncbi:uncharacterized protein LOC131025233 [Salvia miltiorrhiza]|uniref:uncharacterized protein LOC131025233 n=1 Tax=Salvia miltiorrhiza TaxID=226208 RepID=UPI0025ABE32B|nr:uncharacterized protein LOC131025233 [Salvia miltiorrhiza]XP_057810884.1 uncharacterized protein LOC131025233 [Salvia miltiorrhiza]